MSRTPTVDDIIRDWTFEPGDLVTTRSFRSKSIGIVIYVAADVERLFGERSDMYVVAWSLSGGGVNIEEKLFCESIAHVSR